MFDEIERVLPSVKSAAEVSTIATLVEGLLGGHAQLETDFAFVALDQALVPEDRLETIRREHHEMDASLHQVHQAGTCKQARRLLRAAMRASVRHFRDEERYIFPVLERALKPEDLAALGEAFERSRQGEAKPGEQQTLGV